MAKTQKNIAAAVTEIITPIAAELGYDIWDVEYVREGADYYLRVTIDSEDGIGIEDCERFHHAIDAPLDESDPIEGAYHLEVSSPGIERDIRTPAHYRACTGERVCAKLFKPKDGTKVLIGTLVGISDDDKTVTITVGEQNIELERAEISKMNVYFEFND